ncbi:MAG TPA: hypothetical protein VGS80_07220 [Ktedonobacterales bacterium]|nr:hypothetical protein [Ktedonobacterales bacterium]
MPAENFVVKNRRNAAAGEGPELEAGELERAAAWAASLAESLGNTAAARARHAWLALVQVRGPGRRSKRARTG